MVAPQLVHGTGRRKKAVARVFLKKGTGRITVNGKPHDEYFVTDITRNTVTVPLRTVEATKAYDFMVNVQGGGLPGQAGAVALGISRALVHDDEARRSALKANGLLTVDARVKERKKYGRKAARRGFQFVKR